MKKEVRKKILISVVTILIIGLVIVICVILFKNHADNREIEMALNFSSRVEALSDLEEININKFGWLQVQGTNIDVPILTVTNTSSDYSYGWVATNSIGMKTRNVLVGHNVLNVSSSPMVNNSMLTNFEDLMAFVYYNFAKENMYISFTKDGVDKIYVIYSVGFYDYNYDNAQGLNEEDEISEYIEKAKKNSIYDYNIEVDYTDNLLTIKTCTRYFGNDEKQQFVIDARELREGEIPLKYNVKKTKLYQEYNLVDNYQKDNEL